MFRLAHISDPHLTAVPWLAPGQWMSKRGFGYVNWHRNRRLQFGPATLSALVADMSASGPDHVAVTGDLVNLGLDPEFRAASEWLRATGTPDALTLVPGNHDVYMPGSFQEMAQLWGAYMRDDTAVGDPPPTFPFVRRRGVVALIGVNSAVPTPPMWATGMVGATQAEKLSEVLSALGAEGLFRIVLIHHPPAIGSASWRRRLVDAELFRSAIRRSGAELILHGHNHLTHVAAIEGPDRPVPVVGVAAASVLPKAGMPGGSYLMFEIDGRHCRFTERAAMSEDGVQTIRTETLS